MKKFLLVTLAAISMAPAARAEKVVYSDTSTKLVYLIDTDARTARIQGFVSAPKGTLKLPEEITYEDVSYPVDGVLESAFQGSGRLTGLTAGANIKYIGPAAFKNCGMLRSATLEGVEELGDGAFVKCAMLATLKITSTNLHTIGSEAFGECAKLSGSFDIPATVTSIGYNPWYSCTGLTAINAPEGSTKYKTVDGILYDFSGEKLISYPCGRTDAVFTVPDAVKTLGVSSLRGASFTGINLPQGLESIDSISLYSSKLTALTIPASVKFIGVKAITGSFAMTDLQVAPGNNSYKVSDGYLTTADGRRILFSYKRQGALVVPEGVEHLDDYTFMNMTGITSVTLPSSLRTMGEIVFYMCSGITELNLGTGLTSIGRMSFQGCTSLTSVVFPASMRILGKQAFCNDTKLVTVKLNDGLERIDDSAFLGCTAITSMRFPGSLKKMGAAICYQNNSLTEAVLEDGITVVPDQLFNYDVRLRKVTLPDGIKVIERAAFYSNAISEETFRFPAQLDSIGFTAFFKTNFVSLVLPDNLRVIGDWAFASGNALKTVTLGKGTRTISLLAFNNNPTLEKINLNYGLENIGDQAITNCNALPEITVPASVTSYGKECFALNENLRSLTVLNPVPAQLTQNLVSEDEYARITLHVVPEALEAYRTAPIWKKFGAIIGDADGVGGVDDDTVPYVVATFTIDGKKVSDDARGLLLQRLSDGSVRKIMVR